MGGFKDLHLRPVYIKGEHEIAAEFYLPCMERAASYDRAVGFFNSTIYVIAWSALKDFVSGGGRMRLVCSPMLTEDDRQALSLGEEGRIDQALGHSLRTEFLGMLGDTSLEKPARVLAALISIGIIEVRIAIMGEEGEEANHRRIFHDKVGIFQDSHGDRILFKGSMNETFSGLSNDGNLESVDVSVSWAGDWESLRIGTEMAYFDRLWANEYQGVKVKKIPEVAEQEFLKASEGVHWPDLVDEIVRSMSSVSDMFPGYGGRRLRRHQAAGIAAWERQGRKGILEHATGSGKTFTALSTIRSALNRGETPLVLVPSSLLLAQWEREIRETLADLAPKILICGDSHTGWRKPNVLRAYSRAAVEGAKRIILSTMQTAAKAEFRKTVVQGDHLFLVADEVHRLGSRQNRSLLDLQTGPRLGLSATPRRAGDLEGTKALLDYFCGIVPPPYGLFEAIRDGNLTPYTYRPYPVGLTEKEQAEWRAITDKVRQVYAVNGPDKPLPPAKEEWVKRQLIERARIIKSASQKVPLALSVIQEHFHVGQRWIVYCDNQEQVASIVAELRGQGYPAFEYHTAMVGDQAQTLRYLSHVGAIIVAIRCLDEGVDIPAVSHALILASSQNPREFIQRRGRVLRLAPGKYLAHIFDAIVLPELSGDAEPPEMTIVQAEFARATEFARHAINATGFSDLQRFAVRMNIPMAGLTEGGLEDDEE